MLEVEVKVIEGRNDQIDELAEARETASALADILLTYGMTDMPAEQGTVSLLGKQAMAVSDSIDAVLHSLEAEDDHKADTRCEKYIELKGLVEDWLTKLHLVGATFDPLVDEKKGEDSYAALYGAYTVLYDIRCEMGRAIR